MSQQPAPLFRTEAVEAQRAPVIGRVVLVRPVSFAFMTAFAVSLALVIVAFLVWGTYTQRTSVTGQLVPDRGIVKVYAPHNAIVLKTHVREGQAIEQGHLLYVLTGDQTGPTGQVQAEISRQARIRRQSLRAELEKTRELQIEEQRVLRAKLDGLKAEKQAIDGLIGDQKRRVALAHESLARYRRLAAQDYVAAEQVRQKQAEWLGQRAQWQNLARDRIRVEQSFTQVDADLRGIALKHQNDTGRLERELAAIDQELASSEGRRRILVPAPEAGIATAVLAHPGQTVGAGTPLVSIVPHGATLQAHLYAPSTSIGFIKPGDPVLLRYHAFPYQKFGHARGTVQSISQTALSADEFKLFGDSARAQSGAQPLYRITVRLDRQAIRAAGENRPLQSGMLLDADIERETRRLYEWALEPLYSLTGKM